MNSVVIGADPHKLSVTIEVLDERERVLHQGRYGTDRDGYWSMLAAARQFEQRRWAVEGCNGIGRHVAQAVELGQYPGAADGTEAGLAGVQVSVRVAAKCSANTSPRASISALSASIRRTSPATIAAKACWTAGG